MPSVLIVEDETIIARDVAQCLERLGYSITCIARTGEDAVRQALRCKPDIILMDINLRGTLDGVGAGEQIAGTPIIYMTAYNDQHTVHRIRASGSQWLLNKPFTEYELKSIIAGALSSGQEHL